jgi:hypothetical protein
VGAIVEGGIAGEKEGEKHRRWPVTLEKGNHDNVVCVLCILKANPARLGMKLRMWSNLIITIPISC